MRRRHRITLGVTICLFALAFGLDSYFSRKTTLYAYADEISTYIQQQEGAFEEFLSDESFLQRQFLTSELIPLRQISIDLQRTKELGNTLPSNFCLYAGDSLIYWTNNRAFLSDSLYRSLSPGPDFDRIIEMPNGSYLVALRRILPKQNRVKYALSLIPVRNNYSFESKYLVNRFVNNYEIPSTVHLTNEPNTFPVKNSNGLTVSYLNADGSLKDRGQQRLLLFLYIAAFVTLAVFINAISVMLVHRYKSWTGAAFLIFSVFSIRYLSIWLGFTEGFSDLEIFAETFRTPVLKTSLGDLLIDITLLLWMMVFFHREFEVKNYIHLRKGYQYGISSLNYFSIVIGMLMVAGVFKSLVLKSGITFDFDNVFNLDFYSFLAIVGIILLLFALFLFSHRMMLTIMKIGLPFTERMLAMSLSLAIATPVIVASDLMLSIPVFLLTVFCYILIFDLFIDREGSSLNLLWVASWLFVFAALSSLLLFKYNNDADRFTRHEYAQELAIKTDSVAEARFAALRQNLEQLLSTKSNLEVQEEAVLEDQIYDLYTDDKYLLNNYKYEAGLLSGDTLLSAWGEINPPEFLGKLRISVPTGKENILQCENADINHTYLTTIPLGDSNYFLALELIRRTDEASRVYTELLINNEFKNLENLSDYTYAVYRNGIRVDGTEGQYERLLPIGKDALPEMGTSSEIVSTSKRSELIHHAVNGTVVIIGRDMGGYLKPISLFSYIFCLLIITMLLLGLINSFVRALPGALSWRFSRHTSLRNRIQSSVIMLIVVSFIMIGFVTVMYFRTSSDKYHEDRLDRKVASIHSDMENLVATHLHLQNKLPELRSLVEPVVRTHRMDINFYDLEGNLVVSSDENIYRKGIIAPRMGAYAFQSLRKLQNEQALADERIGDLTYKASYVPLSTPDGTLIAYLGLPYYSKMRRMQNDITEFMGTLLNVYVFLLIIAGAIAFGVANSITKPIAEIGEKLKRLKLGKNEPLKWSSKDELGELINEYNSMILKLEENTELLAHSKREEAWREMAKQVAHEIKNPLTPMRLSIQYMQRQIESGETKNIEETVRRVSKRVVDQIDELTQIANVFSNFAKMPPAENSRFVINDLLMNVFELMKREGHDMDMEIYMPEERYYIFADKGQLMRVFNNLLKNAIQAIPDGRRGRIETELKINVNKSRATIRIGDNGTGIPEETQSKVFTPNFTTKSSGTGLGLAISKQIVDSAKGKIYFETVQQVGTNFFIELPITDVVVGEEMPSETFVIGR